MSNSFSTSLGFLNRIRSGSSRGIFIIFALVFILLSGLFIILFNYSQKQKTSLLLEQTNQREESLILNKSIEDEVRNSLEGCLIFNTSNKETDRFQTIYSLKATKEHFDDYKDQIEKFGGGEEIGNDLQALQEMLIDFDFAIAESINSDGQMVEILESQQDAEDSTSTDFFFDESELGINAGEIKKLELMFAGIQHQLFIIDNQFKGQNDRNIEDIRSKSPIFLYIIFSLVIVLMVVVFRIIISYNQNTSVSKLSEVLDHISKGELPDQVLNKTREFQKIVDASNQLVHYLDDASQFAIKIGDGDFDYEFNPRSESDALGNSLIEMRNRLQEVAHEDKIRNWINEGQAKFGEILRQYSDDLDKLGNKIITELVEYLKASQGALFVFKEQEGHGFLELLSAYAYKRKKYIEKKLEIGESLAGQAFEEGKTIYLTDIKSDHYNIQTGLGESKPTSLLIVPLKQEDRIEGIIEIASLEEIEKHQIEFVESIGESIASSLSAGKVNQTTKKLLEDTQEKAEQMKAQEEELRQNMEELAATQEQMERRNKEMEEIQQKLSEEKYLLNALLNSTHDRIYFKDKDSKFIRVSQSMIELFEKEDETEILGKSDFDFGFEEHAKVAFEDEQNIIRTAEPLVDAVEKETWDDGRTTWVSTTKNPLRDLEGKIIGTFGISRDITKNKLVEVEMIKRKEWFENFFKFHPAGFIVLNRDGKVSFATESILTKLKKKKSVGLRFEDVFFNKTFVDFLVDIDFDNTKDEEVEISLVLQNKVKNEIKLLAIAGSMENEDGTQNIFLIQQ